MDWTNESILRFLTLYKTHPCIWNTKHKLHRNRDKVNDAWTDIQSNMGVTCTIPQLKKKKESLMSAYRAYKTKIKNSTAVLGGAVYKPSWFAFATMDSFLASVYLCNASTPLWSNVTYHAEKELVIENDTDTRLGNDDTNAPETEDHAGPRRKKLKANKRHSPEQMSHSPSDQGDGTRFDNGIDEISHPEDECDIIAKLWARKLRRLPEDRRDILIYKINTMVYKECIDSYRTSDSPNMIIPSPVQIFKEENSEMSDDNSFDGDRAESPIIDTFDDTKEFESDTLYEGEAKAFKKINLKKQ